MTTKRQSGDRATSAKPASSNHTNNSQPDDQKRGYDIRLFPQQAPASATAPKQEKYRVSDFRIPAHDEEGHSQGYGFRADKRYGAAVAEVVWSRRFPYRNDSDIYRHALDRHLKWLATLEPDLIKGKLAQLDAINEMLRQSEMIDQMAEAISRMEQIVNKLTARQMTGTAIKMLYYIRKQAQAFEDPLLKAHFARELKARFGHLTVGGNGVSVSAPGFRLNNTAEDAGGTGGDEDEDENASLHTEHVDDDDSGWGWTDGLTDGSSGEIGDDDDAASTADA